MSHNSIVISRRGFVRRVPLLGAAAAAFATTTTTTTTAGASELSPARRAATAEPRFGIEPDRAAALHSSFPAQHPDAVREIVSVSHGNFDRMRELVEARPALAKASWDWGFGDWESALGAASHTGNREIAQYLIARGARPTIFSAAMLGQIEVVRAYCEASPGVQRTHGPHGITLLAHARTGGEQAAAVVEYLEQLGDADIRETDLGVAEDQREGYVGRYVIDGADNPDDVFVVDVRRNAITLRFREDGIARGLKRCGDHTFATAGAPDIRIRFDFTGGRAQRLEITDGQPIVSATRLQE